LALINNLATYVGFNGFGHGFFCLERSVAGVEKYVQTRIHGKFDQSRIFEVCLLFAILGMHTHIQKLAHCGLKLLHVNIVAPGKLNLAAKLAESVNFCDDASLILHRVACSLHFIGKVGERPCVGSDAFIQCDPFLLVQYDHIRVHRVADKVL